MKSLDHAFDLDMPTQEDPSLESRSKSNIEGCLKLAKPRMKLLYSFICLAATNHSSRAGGV